MCETERMKTTIEIADSLFHQAETISARRGIPVNEFLAEAEAEKLRSCPPPANGGEPAWMKAFGGLADLHAENVRLWPSSS